MKIAFILPSFPCISETFILTQIVEFVKMGHDVAIYAMSKSADTILHQEFIKYRLDLRTKYVRSSSHSKFLLRTKAAWGVLIHFLRAPKLFGPGIIRMLFSDCQPFDYNNLFLFFLLGSQKNDILFCHFGQVEGNIEPPHPYASRHFRKLPNDLQSVRFIEQILAIQTIRIES